MHVYIRFKKRSAKELLYCLFLILCFIPFLFPNPIVRTNVQPYASIVAVVILLLHSGSLLDTTVGKRVAAILSVTFFIAVIILVAGGISMDGIRGVYNYFALFVVPCAAIIVFSDLPDFPEGLCKTMIVIWFLVASVQFFFNRGFATQLIGAVRWSYRYRGVVGLASEPSFLGIASFYFAHMIRRFRTHRLLFYVISLITGVLYAQSATGVMFIAGFYAVLLLDIINSKKGLYIWIASLFALIWFGYFLSTSLADSRLNQMIDAFFNGGVDSVLSDGSASVRFNAIGRALRTAAGNRFMPNGFGARVGSAYGGLLVELGIFAVPAILLISYSLSLTFDKVRSRVAYFIVVTLLLLNNTQIGNPLLLMVVGLNLYCLANEKRARRTENDTEVYQRA